MTSGFSFGTPSTNTAATTGGFSFGTTPGAAAGGLTFGTTKPTGVAFGTPAATTVSTGLSFGAGKTTFGTPAASGGTTTGFTSGFSLGGATPAASKPATGFTLGTTPATTATGFSLGTTPAAGAGTGFSLGSTPAASGFSLGTTPASASTGFTLGGTPASGLGTGLGLGTTPATGTLGGLAKPATGGLFQNTGLNLSTKPTTSSLTLAPAFSATSSAPSNKGLGGINPQVTTSNLQGNGNNGKPSDSKAVKETGIPNEIVETVENFKKYVKDQKVVRENIARMSSKPVFRVQEDVQSIRQLLSVVSNGLQRNAGAIEKLKMETAQEMKNVETAQRTKDTPPGLQYENTAPADYFQQLVEDFELRMQVYRQQIDNVESHFASLNQPAFITPQDLTNLLRKLHETFIALAAQLQVIHEAVKTQKEHYLNYRKVFHGESQNIFQTQKKMAEKTGQTATPIIRTGPTAFTGISNATAVAMATAMNRGQQPQAGAPPTLGLNAGFSGTQPTGQIGAFGGFGNTSSLGGIGFGGTQSAISTPAPVGFGTPAFGAGNTTGFQLQKPPSGTKRGKKN
ncbi:nucleoporin p58/p45-like isoform X2 [Tubulanus polymorphus]|uniref:nucleoporin p58/p45-like isoform X2 n=1 Tax=Tubulanus polymorphus TaxID=672921 RepID=UPI003DA3A23B